MDINLDRFIEAHKRDYKIALNEIKSGRKRSHWMWYIFPQIKGLGRSSTSQYYAINSLDEAREFLNNDYLRKNIIEICNTLLKLDSDNATEIFGRPDDMKLKSSMTLFAYADGSLSVFKKVIDKFYKGKYDFRTLKKLGIKS